MDTPSGTCDGCRKVPAKYWYGQTNRAHCGRGSCREVLDEEYRECSRKIEEDMKWREEEGY